MNAIISWASTITSPFTSLTGGKRTRLFFLALVSVCLAVAGYLKFSKTAPRPALMAERVEASPTLSHTPEPAALNGSIAITQSLPPPVTLSAPIPPTPDPLLLEHSKKLADLGTLIVQIRGDLSGMASRLDGFQDELHGIKQQMALRSRVLAKAIHNRYQGRPNFVKVRQHRHRTRVNSHNDIVSKADSEPGIQIIALNKWGAESRLIVRQQGSNQYRQLRLGDPLSGGTIVGMNARKVTIRKANGIATVDLAQGRP
ncbi:MAG: hypothetical protein HOO93_10405 [Methyloglobulus sp.]|nr:hypothetical protein [Methyloglobulus sp.]